MSVFSETSCTNDAGKEPETQSMHMSNARGRPRQRGAEKSQRSVGESSKPWKNLARSVPMQCQDILEQNRFTGQAHFGSFLGSEMSEQHRGRVSHGSVGVGPGQPKDRQNQGSSALP